MSQSGDSGTGDGGTVEFDLHGLAGVRLVDAMPADRAAVQRQLGPIGGPLNREPEIVVRFVDRLEMHGPLTYVGRDDAAFTDDAFLLLRSRHKSRVRVQIPLDRVGGRCEIVCEHGVLAVPLLLAIVNLTVLANGSLPLHAAAFRHRGTGVVVTGWSKAGKTETLLAFGGKGAEYIGAEWVYLSSDGSEVFGIPEPIRIWSWHLDQLPDLHGSLDLASRARLRALGALARVDGAADRRRLPGAGWLRRAMPIVDGQLHVDVPPQRLVPGGLGMVSAPFDVLFFMASREDPTTVVSPIDAGEVAARMAFSLEHERLDLRAAYLKFRYAFPDRRNALIEDAPILQRELLTRIVAGKPTYRVDHPYPSAFGDLYDAMAPYCDARGAEAGQ